MGRDDPFGLYEDRGRTRIRPPPAAAAPRGPAPGAASVAAVTGASIRRLRQHPNPLVNAFAPLLEFAPELEAALAPGDPEALRARLHGELVAARDEAVKAGVPLERADAAAWAVAALLDDLALNTPWGGASAWPRQPLVTTLSGDVDAGAQFFARLEALERSPARDRHLLELHHLCLLLGFRGRYRVPGRAGDSSLAAVRAAAARALRDPEAEAAPLSPHWEGVVATDGPRRFAVPIWVLFAAAVALSTAVYLALSVQLSTQAEGLATLVRAVPPSERPEIYRGATLREAPPDIVDAAAIAPVDFALLPEFEAAAPPGLRPALTGRESVSLATLVIQWADPEVFQSARAELTDGFRPLIAAIGATILENEPVIGNVTVVGHTDSIPLSATNPLGSNQRLSEARARTIAALLVDQGVPPDRIRAEGRAAAEPVASNETREGRALNRRVEILIEKRL
jgi:type VI secretion system protein ImpK